ncbi:hypothetical protein GN958_ATG13279, partial [Phytophthora infestans]
APKKKEHKSLLQEATTSDVLFTSSAVVNLPSFPAPRIYITTEDTLAIIARTEWSYARMEFEGIAEFWVDGLRMCDCRYLRKSAVCVHLQFAMRHRSHI